MMIANPITNVPRNLRSRRISTSRKTATATNAPVVRNSYMLPHGTRPAPRARVITPAPWIRAPRTVRATATTVILPYVETCYYRPNAIDIFLRSPVGTGHAPTLAGGPDGEGGGWSITGSV